MNDFPALNSYRSRPGITLLRRLWMLEAKFSTTHERRVKKMLGLVFETCCLILCAQMLLGPNVTLGR